MSKSLKDQFSVVEDEFLTAISQGSAAVEAFDRSWSSLQATFEEAIKDDSVDDETFTLAQQIYTRIEVIATQFLELHVETEAIVSSWQSDLDSIFADLNISELSAPASDGVFKSTAHEMTVALPPYNEPAYTWLLNNLHNPYPSRDIKTSIVLQTGASLKDIDNWFINVRKRIGWNKLRVKHYQNKRSRIVDAATRFFKEASHHPHLRRTSAIDPTASYSSEFKFIENRARDLYSDKSFETSLATKYDDTDRDLMPKTKVRAQSQEQHHRQLAKSKRDKDLQHLSAYPSPERSPERSPEPSLEQFLEPSLPLPFSNPDATQPTSRKRRSSDRDSPELDIEERRDESQKRSRLDSYQISRDLAVASLPSPAASLSDITRDSSATPSDKGPSENDCTISPTVSIPTTLSGKRKRRLSDAGHDSASKRPHNALAVPRLQTVSDPLPLANPTSELYKTLFGQTISDTIPGPVGVESLDDTQVEVDFYSYDTSPDILQSFLLADSSLGPYPTALSPLLVANSESPSLDKPQVADSNLDFLFENYLKDMPPQATDIPFFDIPSHDHPTLFSFEDILPTQPPQEDILSDPYFQIPGLWDFQENGDSLSTIVPSMGTLFSNDPVPPQIDSTQNEKEAKRKQIEALWAQIQSLEAEP